MTNYKPLPDSLTIKESNIQGLGLFAVERIPAGRFLGMGWIKAEVSIAATSVSSCSPTYSKLAHDGVWRTPLGGFINHSDTPNCVKELKEDPTSEYIFLTVGDNDIEAGEELTVKYTFYTV